MWRGFVGSCWLGPGCPVLRADTRENPVGKNGVMTNGLDGAIGGKNVPERSFVLPKKHVFGWNLLTKPTPYLFSGPNYLVRSVAKLFRAKTLLNLASKALSNSFFQKTRFRFEFL